MQKFLKKKEQTNYFDYLIKYSESYFTKSKNDNIKFLKKFINSAKQYWEKSNEVLIQMFLLFSKENCLVKTNIYMKARKGILDILSSNNRCQILDNVTLTMRKIKNFKYKSF